MISALPRPSIYGIFQIVVVSDLDSRDTQGLMCLLTQGTKHVLGVTEDGTFVKKIKYDTNDESVLWEIDITESAANTVTIKSVALKQWLHQVKGEVLCKKKPRKWEIRSVPHRVYIQSALSNNYLYAPFGESEVRANYVMSQAVNLWFVEKVEEGAERITTVTMRSHQGYYLSVNAQTGNLELTDIPYHWHKVVMSEVQFEEDHYCGWFATLDGSRWLAGRRSGTLALCEASGLDWSEISPEWVVRSYEPHWPQVMDLLYGEIQMAFGGQVAQAVKSLLTAFYFDIK